MDDTLTATLTDIVETLCDDGIVHAPGVLDADRCAALLNAVDRSRNRPSPQYRRLTAADVPGVESDLFRWRDVPEIRELVVDPALLAVAGAYLATDDPVVLEDQWFWSGAGATADSPWHQDEPYHPLDRPFLTVWLPVTPVPPGCGLRGVAGSHEGPMYGTVEFSSGDPTLSAGDDALLPVPDVDGDPGTYRVVAPDAAPGDAVVLDSRTLHSAGGHCAWDFVRLSIRYAHPDTRRRGRSWATAGFWDDHAWSDGDTLPAEAFPRASALAAGAVRS